MSRGRKLESVQDFQRALKNKYGIGEGFNYKPWLRIQDVKSHGIRSLIFGRKSQREHHMMSSIEAELFYLAEFSDSVVDIREQFPILPLNYTQKVANMLGVEHPTHPNTKEPIIMTTDQLLTIDSTQGISYHAISVKPESESNKQRVLEKIDIERVCWELLGVKFSYFTGNELTKTQNRHHVTKNAKKRSYNAEKITFSEKTKNVRQRREDELQATTNILQPKIQSNKNIDITPSENRSD